jgi:class 3 adenylate cyclase/tetratricopeptide (TPR) repeat protein
MSSSDERKLATILFADLVGSTALADSEDPERVRVLLDRFYDVMAEEIERTGGTVEKFAGDAVMAVFGAPVALEDHAERALHTALAMRGRLAQLHESLSLRIGVNTGEVVVGRSRAGSSFVSGDAVNVCARLEQAAEPGEILAGERTVTAAGGAFEFGSARDVDAKGKPAPVAARPVLRALSLARPRGIGELGSVFVGRDAELEVLGATYRRAVAGREPHLVTIVGEPGVGKTTLVRELWARLGQEQQAPVLRTGRCLPYGDGITYWPIGEILKEQFGILESEEPEQVMTRLAGREVLGVALGFDVAGKVHPIDVRERLHAGVVELVEELGAEASLVTLVEDVHWAEDDLLELLERVVHDARAPLVVLATARPELFDRRPNWGGGRRNATTIWLEPLPPDSTSLMLAGLLATELPAALRDLVVARAEGNPFFVEELVRSLVEAGALERRNGDWQVNDIAEGVSVPDSVQAVLAARMDRLGPSEKAALQAAAVVGRTFWHGPVLHLLEGETPDFGLLEERDFIRRRGGSTLAGETEYAMKHALTRDVAYSSIPKARRGRLHAAFAAWMVENDRANDEHASLLAYHLAEAVRPEDADLAWADDLPGMERLRAEAVRWLRRAGELARSRYEMEEAIELFTRAAELTPDDHERALLWREIGQAQALRYDGEAFWAAMERSLDGPLSTHERADAFSRLAFETSIRSGMWSIRPGKDRIETWVSRALELAEDGSIESARALLARANAEPAEASEDLLDSVTTAAEKIGDPDLLSFTFGARSHTAFEHLQFEESAAWIERRIGLVPDIADPDSLCEVYESAVPVVAALGRFDEARRLAAEHWEIARRLSAHHRVHAASLRLEIDETLGQWSALADEMELVSDLVARNLATPCVRNARDLLLGALAHVCVGDELRARELELQAASLAGEGHERELATPRLRIALERGDAKAARALVRLPLMRTFVWGSTVFGTLLDALIMLREYDWIEREAPRLQRPGTVVEPFALRALGAARDDSDLLSRADEHFGELGLEWYGAQSEKLLKGF